jgi:CHAT domain-containing protein
VDQQSDHLSNAEIERYGDTVPPGEPAVEDRRERIEAHLADCPACRERVLASQRVRLALLATSPVTTAPDAERPDPNRSGVGQIEHGRTDAEHRGPDCPDEDDLRHLAAGLCPPDQATRLTQHAAQCDHCGPLLRMYVEDFSDELSKEDDAVMAKLKSSSGGWQKKLAQEMLKQSGASYESSDSPAGSGKARARQPFPWRWVLAPTALAACAAIAFAVWYQQRETPEKVERLLAQAYTEQRTAELRIPGAAYAPLRQERGGSQSPFSIADRPQALLQAELAIDRKLKSDPNNPEWLEKRALADVLEKQFNEAIEDLETVRAQHPDSSTVLTLLGIAHYERGQSVRVGGDQTDAAKNLTSNDCVIATENLSRALDLHPSDPVVLYNLAFAHTCLKAYKSAIADWEAYLKLDSTSAWAGEAKKRLAELKALLLSHDGGLAVRLMVPTVLAAAKKGNGYQLADSRIEEYLEAAVKDWLPALSSAPNLDPVNLRVGLALIAQVLDGSHGDPWLRKILALPPSNELHQALLALGQASQANESGNPEAAREAADRADRLFRNLGSRAGTARAQFEKLYALRRSAQPCYLAAKALSLSRRVQPYKWILIQSRLELSSCAALAGKIGEAERYAEDSARLAQRYNLPILHLRGLAFRASLQRSKGAFFEAWSSELSGLGLYWAGSYPPIRAYLFYTDLGFLAEDTNLWHVAYAMADEAVQQISQTPNVTTEAMARTRLANLALMVDQTDIAKREYQRASAIFSTLPEANSTRTYRADSQLGLAKIEVSRGQLDSATGRLEEIRSQLPQISSKTVARRFHLTLAKLQYRQGKTADAKNSLQKAIDFGESELDSLATDRDRVKWERENGEAYRLLTQLEVEENKPEEALALWEWYRSAPLRNQRGSPILASPTSMVSEMKHARATLVHQSLLTYAILPGGVSVWLSDDRGLTAFWVPGTLATLAPLVAQFAGECANRYSNLSQLNSHARRLYEVLIRPVFTHLQLGRTLIVELDDPLYAIPFQVLLDSEGRYFGATFRLIYSPGIVYGTPDQAHDTKQEELVVGSTATDAAAPNSLPEVEQEAKAVAHYFRRAELLIGKDAEVESVLRRLQNASLFHFAGHAASLEYGTHAGLLLFTQPNKKRANDTAVLDASRLESIQFHRCQLVVLSACSTAKSSRGGFADPDSLVRAFLRSGARQVIASHWAVDSTTTVEFMGFFYDSLRYGKTVSEALQRAQRRVRGAFPHPYYWASFNVFGAEDVEPNLHFSGDHSNTVQGNEFSAGQEKATPAR